MLNDYGVKHDVECLHFTEFVQLLDIASNDRSANEHIRSQRFECPIIDTANTTTVMTTIQDVARHVNSLKLPTFPTLEENPQRWHNRSRPVSEEITEELLQKLRRISLPEYDYISTGDLQGSRGLPTIYKHVG